MYDSQDRLKEAILTSRKKIIDEAGNEAE